MNKQTLTTILLIVSIAITVYFVVDLLLKPQMFYDENGNPAKRLPPIIYYTIQTNIMVIVFLIGVTLARLGIARAQAITYNPALALPLAIYITVTSLVYWLVLLPMMGFKGWFFSPSNIWLHTVTPVLTVLLILNNVHDATMTHVLTGLAYPLAYLIISLIVAQNTGKYTYPFLNPAVMGSWGGVAVACVAMTGFFIALGWGYLRWISKIHLG